MKPLVVHYDYLSETFAVINTVDGRIVDRFTSREEAESFALHWQLIEAQRIAEL